MKFVILTEKIGGGHISVANAIKQYLLKKHPDSTCAFVGSLKYISPILSEAMSIYQDVSYRYFPRIQNSIYKNFNKKKRKISEQSLYFKFFAFHSDRLYNYIVENDIDYVVCVQVFDALALTDVIHKHPELKIKTGFVATDYSNDLVGVEKYFDFYFVPDISLKSKFIKIGIPEDKIIDSSMPVCSQFFTVEEKNQAKRDLGIPENLKHLLVMTGSMGAGSLSSVVTLLLDSAKKGNYFITIICGTNKSLKFHLQSLADDSPFINVVGYTKNVSLYMDSADLLLTKPGGLSSSEAMVKHLPTVFVDSVGGWETENANFMVSIGLAKTAKKKKDIAALCEQLLNDDKALYEMSHSVNKSKEQLDGAANIVETFIHAQN